MNLRQRRFVDEYLIDLDGKHAAIRAGYAASDAKNRACRFLKTPEIANAIAAAMAERSRRTGNKPERVLEELARRRRANAVDAATRPGDRRELRGRPIATAAPRPREDETVRVPPSARARRWRAAEFPSSRESKRARAP